MSVVAIEAVRASCVLGVLHRSLVVAIDASSGRDRRRRMRMVAFVAGRREVHADGRGMPLRFGVARHARGRLPRCEEMTGEAIGFLFAAGVGVRHLLLVTSATYPGTGILEAFDLVVVAILAADRPFADVLLMAGARAKLCPRGGHDLRRYGGDALREDAEKTRDAGGDQHEHGGRARQQPLAGGAHHTPP